MDKYYHSVCKMTFELSSTKSLYMEVQNIFVHGSLEGCMQHQQRLVDTFYMSDLSKMDKALIEKYFSKCTHIEHLLMFG